MTFYLRRGVEWTISKYRRPQRNGGLSTRRVLVLCAEGKIDGVIRRGKLYMIPANAQKPADGRLARVNLLAEIEAKCKRLTEMRPLTQGGGGAAP